MIFNGVKDDCFKYLLARKVDYQISPGVVSLIFRSIRTVKATY